LAFLNDLEDLEEKLPPKRELIVPRHAIVPLTWDFRALMHKDLTVYNIEYNMTLLDKQPTFWAYYCTRNADVLGRLILSDADLIFEPMNDNFKGWCNYASNPGSPDPAFHDPQAMNLIVNYADVCIPESKKATTRTATATHCYVKVGLYQTGNM
jgi:hypothetical protein